ncbi:MAG TPA: hypothetical protein VF841_04430, partial [Anaeromyxobacter sp.]
MRHPLPAVLLLVGAACALPPLRPADPSQAVANERSAGTAFADGIRIVVRPGAWRDAEDLEQTLTPIEVAIHNGSARGVQVRPASFSLLVPGGFRYEALSTDEVRRVLGPMRAGMYGGYTLVPWGPPLYPWGGPYGGWWGWGGFGPGPWWGPYVAYGGPPRVPSHAFTRGTLEPGGDASILLLFPVPADDLDALELDARLSDTSGQRLPELRVPFVREGRRAQAMRLPPAATGAPAPGQPGGAEAPPGAWQTV